MARGVVIFVVVLQCLGPCGLYLLAYRVVIRATQESTKQSEVAAAIVEGAARPLFGISFAFCTSTAIQILMSGTDHDFPLLNDIQWLMRMVALGSSCGFGIVCIGKADMALEAMATERVTNDVYLKRKEFMNEVAYGSHIAGATATQDEHGFFLYSYVWRPVYLSTVFVLSAFFGAAICGFSTEGFWLVVTYVATTLLLSIFGARTLGPEIYGGLVLFLDRPFVEGDIISLDKNNSQGGAQTDVMAAVVTGFVERIGIRSVVVRRFDMRAVWVPNSYFIKFAVANWNTRPRKLIYVEFSVSHRTPPEVCKAFQEAVHYLVKNHPDVDQQQYVKAVFRKLEAGLDFLLVCFNARGTKKQQVQQDLLLRIIGIARTMGVKLLFNHATMNIEREEISGDFYPGVGEPTREMQTCREGGFDLSDIQPPKKNCEPSRTRFAPKGQLVVRVERVVIALDGQLDASPGRSRITMARGTTKGHMKNPGLGSTLAFQSLRVRLRVRSADERSTVGQASAADGSGHSGSWTRTARLGRSDAVDSAEARFFENLSFPFDTNTAGDADLLPDYVDFQVAEVGKGFLWRRRFGSVGFAVGRVRELALQAGDTNAVELDLQDREHRTVVGKIFVRIYTPEASKMHAAGKGPKSSPLPYAPPRPATDAVEKLTSLLRREEQPPAQSADNVAETSSDSSAESNPDPDLGVQSAVRLNPRISSSFHADHQRRAHYRTSRSSHRVEGLSFSSQSARASLADPLIDLSLNSADGTSRKTTKKSLHGHAMASIPSMDAMGVDLDAGSFA